MNVLRRVCEGGDTIASLRAAQIDLTLKTVLLHHGELRTLPPVSEFVKMREDAGDAARKGMYPMRSCKLAATLVMVIAAPDEQLARVLGWLSRSLGGLPSPEDVLRTRSADVGRLYGCARERAEARGETTVLGVNLVDVEMLVTAGLPEDGGAVVESFAHAFVLVVAPAGVRVIQAWGEDGYSLGENLCGDESRLRSLDEGAEYVGKFVRLCAMKVGQICLLPTGC
jgi:hypothetical protein